MKKYLIITSILLIALFVRFYNFSNRITFGPEQARSLMVSSNYIQDKPSLLGQEYFRANSLGHKLYTSAVFNYSLVPLLLAAKYDPYLITIYFCLLNVFTGLVIYKLCKTMFSKEVALISSLLFLLNSYMIYHSMFIWVLNYLPLLGIISFYLVWKIVKQKAKYFDLVILGVLSGIGFGLEYLYAIAILIILFFIVKFSKQKLLNTLLFVVGGVIGDITQMLFDVRHDFYHLNSLWQYALDTFSGKSDAGFIYYHFLEFWPIMIIFLAIIIFELFKRNKLAAYIFISLYLYVNFSSSLISFTKPVGMEDGLTLKDIQQTSKIISENAKDNFNVVTLYDFDTRGYTLRYFVQYVYGAKPQNDVSYKDIDEIYALAKSDYDYSNNNPWELNVFKPYNIVNIANIGNGYVLSKLTKLKK